MRIELISISPRRQKMKSAAAQRLVTEFAERAGRYQPVSASVYGSEAELLSALDRSSGRTPAVLILLDSHGDSLTSEEFATRLGELRDSGTQEVLFAVGPPDGWSSAARGRARWQLSFGRVTLPHELALVVLAEQVYRALTILAGHPYHSGHSG